MSDPFLGQIEIFAFDFAPKGWALCAGQLLSVAQNPALFGLLGVTFGGDGRTTFGLPVLRGATAIGQGKGDGLTPRPMGAPVEGEEDHALLMTETPFHGHYVWGRYDPTTVDTNTHIPANNVVLAKAVAKDSTGVDLAIDIYLDLMAPPVPPDPAKPRPLVQMAKTSISSVGGGQAHENTMPYVTLNVCISLTGPIPPRN